MKSKKTIELKTGLLGYTFQSIAERAKGMASAQDAICYYDFNGVTVHVGAETDLDRLWRDMQTAYIVGWKSIGPIPDVEYSEAVKSLILQKKKEREEKQREWEAKEKKKDDEQKATYERATKGTELSVVNRTTWDEYVTKNQAPYGKCCVDYAEAWGKYMQAEMAKGETVAQCAERTSYALGYFGITGFMYGAAVAMLSECWEYGAELKAWHNAKYNHKGDGVVNPAVLTIAANENPHP